MVWEEGSYLEDAGRERGEVGEGEGKHEPAYPPSTGPQQPHCAIVGPRLTRRGRGQRGTPPRPRLRVPLLALIVVGPPRYEPF